MCVYIAGIATILQVMLRSLGSVPAFASRTLKERQCTLEEEEIWYENVQDSVQGKGMHTGGGIFF